MSMPSPAVTSRSIIHVALACDRHYMMPLCTAMQSLIDSASEPSRIAIHILAHGVPVPMMDRISAAYGRLCQSLTWHQADMSNFAGFSTLSHVSKATFARLLLPSVMPAELKRVIYLDSDLLVLGDLGTLYDSPLGECSLGAARDKLDIELKSNSPAGARLPRVAKYFNAGVLLIDLPAWRERRVVERAVAYLTEHQNTPFADQDALNVVCDGDWHELDGSWNCQEHLAMDYGTLPPSERPHILHFITAQKPWLASSASLNKGLFRAYRDRTAYRPGPIGVLLQTIAEAYYGGVRTRPVIASFHRGTRSVLRSVYLGLRPSR